MKKAAIAVLLSLVVSTSAFAHGHGGYRGGWGYGFIVPSLVGGVIGYEIARSQQPPVVVQQPVIVQPQPVIIQQPQQQFCEHAIVTDQFGIQRAVPYCYTR